MGSGSAVPVIVVILVVVLCCCLIVALALFGGLGYGLSNLESGEYYWAFGEPTETPLVIRPTLVPTQQGTGEIGRPEDPVEDAPVEDAPVEDAPVEDAPVEDAPVEEQPLANIPLVSTETLDTLENTDVPINDLRDLARKLKGITDIPQTLDPPSAYFDVGAQQKFWVMNVDTNLN